MNKRVYVYECGSYDYKNLIEIFSEYFKKEGCEMEGRKILLKPNMLQAHRPSENVTTHPEVVKAAAAAVMKNGGICSIGDSPSGRGRLNAESAAEKCGFLKICRDLNIDFDYFDGQQLRQVDIKNGRIFKKVLLPESYFSYDIIINMPKLKTHSLTVFTLGIKNMLGVVPGLGKTEFHRRALHPDSFADAICDLFSVLIPDYTILDAVEAMEGAGPVTGKTKKLKKIIIGKDSNAVDSTAERICGADPLKVPITYKAAKRGLGEMEGYEVIGNRIVADENFKKPPGYTIAHKIPKKLLSILSLFYGHVPSLSKRKCIGCRKCFNVCPSDAISFSVFYPEFNIRKCTKCFCCAERCPESAIGVKKKLLSRITT